MLTLKFPDHNVTLQVDADELTDDQVEEVYNHYFSTLDVEPGSPETRPDPTLTPEPQPTEPTFYKVPPEPPLPQETQAQTPAVLRPEPSPSTQPPAIYTETREVPAPRIDPLEQVDAEVDAELEVSKIAPWDPSSFDETLDENPIFEGINKAIDTLSPFFMTAAEEKSMRAKHPNLMALRYSAASLLLPGVSEKFASPMELEAFTKKSTEDQRLEILGLTAGYAAFGAAGKGAQALLGLAAKKFPSLTKPIAQLFKDSNWFRRMTNRERGLVVQSIDDMKKAGLSEAEILRGIRGPEREKFFDAAMKDRGAGSVAEQPQKPKKLPDAEEIGETIAEESWKVTGGKLIKPIELTSKERLLAGAKKPVEAEVKKPKGKEPLSRDEFEGNQQVDLEIPGDDWQALKKGKIRYQEVARKAAKEFDVKFEQRYDKYLATEYPELSKPKPPSPKEEPPVQTSKERLMAGTKKAKEPVEPVEAVEPEIPEVEPDHTYTVEPVKIGSEPAGFKLAKESMLDAIDQAIKEIPKDYPEGLAYERPGDK
ncbi:hypothetical protein LCGC14_2263640, partial [marine sediment metagenome]